MVIAMTDVSKTYRTAEGPLTVLDGIDLSLSAGESLALTGESGSGKSTLLHLAAGLDEPDRGQILIDGADMAALGDAGRAALRRSTVGLIFQHSTSSPR